MIDCLWRLSVHVGKI